MPIEFGTADDCLFEFGHLQAGETVLVQAGAGGVGLAAIQLAKAAGASIVLATASSDDRLGRLTEYGMDHGINYARRGRRRSGCASSPTVAASTSSSTPSAARTLEGSIAALAYRGRISWVGRAGREARPPEVWPLMEKNASLTGVFLGAEMGRDPHRVRAMIERSAASRRPRRAARSSIDRVLPARRGRRRPPLHREPPGLRAGAAAP